LPLFAHPLHTTALLVSLAATVVVVGPQSSNAQNPSTGMSIEVQLMSALQGIDREQTEDLGGPKAPPKDPKGKSPQSVRPRGAQVNIYSNGTAGIVDKTGKTVLPPSRMTVGTNGLISVNGRPWGVMTSAGTIVVGLTKISGTPHAGKLSELRTALASAAGAKNAVNRPPSGGLLGGDSPGMTLQGPAATGRPTTPPKPNVIY
jgi:hypothetical protein